MGSGFVQHNKHPFYWGRIVKLKKDDSFAVINFVNQYKPLIFAEVPGYSILIVFHGNLYGYKVTVSGPGWEKELQIIFDQMADWFLKEKIFGNPGYYKRYRTD